MAWIRLASWHVYTLCDKLDNYKRLYFARHSHCYVCFRYYLIAPVTEATEKSPPSQSSQGVARNLASGTNLSAIDESLEDPSVTHNGSLYLQVLKQCSLCALYCLHKIVCFVVAARLQQFDDVSHMGKWAMWTLMARVWPGSKVVARSCSGCVTVASGALTRV